MSSTTTLRDVAARLIRTQPANAGRPVDHHDLDRIVVPDTTAAREAAALCCEISSAALASHCFRSYAWASLFGLAGCERWDAELLYVAAMLHDAGLTPRFDRGGCFEYDGADAARELLRGLGWETTRSEEVARAIVLHMHDVAPEDPVEARLLELGTGTDVRGRRYEDLGEGDRRAVLELFPRQGFKEEFIELMVGQARRKPQCAAYHYVNALDAPSQIRAAPFES
jgi:hypothetical protein